jgi:formylglycine-generating enzyme required for sulfatase activity/predicted esterase
MTEQTLSHYRILEKLGEGGMGVVYRALDTRLDRQVALKLLPAEAVGDPERKWRFVREAKAASALNHPNIVTIYDIDSAPFDGGEVVDFIAMECVEGTTLDRVVAQRRLPIEEALGYAVQIAGALAAAHTAGIVHRDVKPGNIIVTSSGQVKVLDFGLAKLMDARASETVSSTDSLAGTITAATAAPGTREGAVLGTLSYMSPEQAQGKAVDARSDVFSLGSVLYELLSGKRPFQGDSNLMTLATILRDPAPPLASVRPDVPADLERVVARALEKNPENRYPSAAEMRDDLVACQARRAGRSAGTPSARRPGVVAGLALLAAAALGAAAWYFVRESRVRRAREVSLPAIARLIDERKLVAAVRLARQTERYAPEEIKRLRRTWIPVSVTTEPAGAEVSFKDYLGADSDWQSLGPSPAAANLPFGYYRWRISKDGFQTVESVSYNRPLVFRLNPPAAIPSGMVRVAGGNFQYRSAGTVALADYWLDKYEATNKQFKEFVDRGGYQRRDSWQQPFVKDGRTLSFEEAMADFKDSTGRPGPSTWELGTYPEGRADYPVNGVSWYEAAAYAEFAGKSLPTIYHWYNAAGIGIFSDILRLSNFGGKGPAPVGSYQGLTSSGAYDMAGNVKEWCWNAIGDRRYILGGAWSEPGYMFSSADAQFPFDRSVTNGFRCAKYAAPVTGEQAAPVERLTRDYSRETPVSDDVFRIYRGFYAYDKTPLNATIESVDESSPYWRKQKVLFDAAYAHERIPAYLFLPRNVAPPYQTVVYFPSSLALSMPLSEDLEPLVVDFVIRSGRALLHPVYKGTYERRDATPREGPNEDRDLVIQWSKDMGRSLDYLETRPDIDRTKFAYYGLSMGSITALPVVAVEDRFKTAILLAGGLPFTRTPPEVDPVNFAPRISIPVLLLGGRQDFIHPVDSAQVPLVRLLGTPEKDKKHIIFEGGHAPLRVQVLIKDILDWLDRYLGPVKTQS